jgi:putative ABC transport system ATP-binding protein
MHPYDSESPLLEIADVSRRYVMGSETIYALRDVSFRVDKGEWVGIGG